MPCVRTSAPRLSLDWSNNCNHYRRTREWGRDERIYIYTYIHRRGEEREWEEDRELGLVYVSFHFTKRVGVYLCMSE